jgi:type IV pilus biogenesis protein CpaD/CtpE
MRIRNKRVPFRTILVTSAIISLAGCASVNVNQTLERTNKDAATFTQG